MPRHNEKWYGKLSQFEDELKELMIQDQIIINTPKSGTFHFEKPYVLRGFYFYHSAC